MENSKNKKLIRQKENTKHSKVYYFVEKEKLEKLFGWNERKTRKKIQWNIKMKSLFEKTLNDLNIL